MAAEMKRRVVASLHLRSGAVAADVGCGDGFYTLPLARFLGASGKVYAEDISDAELMKLKEHLAQAELQNVEVIKGAVDDPKLPVGRLDAALNVNAYHEMTEHEAMLRHVRAALKSGGTFVLMEGIWDSREGQPRDEQIKHHQLPHNWQGRKWRQGDSTLWNCAIHFLSVLPTRKGSPDGGSSSLEKRRVRRG